MQGDLRTKALTFFTTFGVVFGAIVTLGLVIKAEAADFQTVASYFAHVACTSSGQLCDRADDRTIFLSQSSDVQLKYTVNQYPSPLGNPSGHCSSVSVDLHVDGILKGSSPFLGWTSGPGWAADPLGRPLSHTFDVGVLSAGNHTFSLRARGTPGGCNQGRLASWGGPVQVNAKVSAQVTATPTPTPTPTSGTTGSIGDFVWRDTNGNGVQNGGEPGVSGVGVALRDCSDNTLATTSTNGNGLYQFSNLAAGCYKVKFDLPGGFIFSPRNVGGDSTDSDAGEASGVSHPIDLSSGESDLTVDAGLISTATVTPTPTATPTPTVTPTATPTITPTPTPTIIIIIRKPQCDDGIDNDGDGRVDLADLDCTDRFDDREFGERDDDDDFINFFKVKNKNVNFNTNINNNSNHSDNDVHVETGDVTVTTGSVHQTVDN